MRNVNIKIGEQILKLLKKYELKNISVELIYKKLKLNNKKKLLRINNKRDLLKCINEYFDNKMKIKLRSIDKSSSRDMIFEILMIRFDLLNEHRVAVKKIFNFLMTKPDIFILLLPSFIKSMDFMSTIAGIKTNKTLDFVKLKGLLVIYFSTFLTWIKDEKSSLDTTMKVLDNNLNKAENILNLITK